jgi:methionyl-tRNA synthetase
VGHKIGTAGYLFTQIKAEKEVEWREQFGGAEARKAKESSCQEG